MRLAASILLSTVSIICRWGGSFAEEPNSSAVCSSDLGGDGEDEESCKIENSNEQCGLFLAESTIPGAGVGIYAGKHITEGETMDSGDIGILFDFEEDDDDTSGLGFALFGSYVWNADALGTYFEIEGGDEGSAFSPGLGGAVNCWSGWINAYVGAVDYDSAGVHRSNNPGAGAFSSYHNRSNEALKDIPAGSEIFSEYGNSWFLSRTQLFGKLPFEHHFEKADEIIRKYWSLLYDVVKMDETDLPKHIDDELWLLAANLPFDSRTMNALPKTMDKLKDASEMGSVTVNGPPIPKRSVEWLRENGKCLDNLKGGKSTIPEAGRGAFATRFIPKGSIIAPGPLVHTPDRKVFERGDRSQLILNYCFGHKKSSVLLSPYTHGVSYINHDSKSPNAVIQWANESFVGHNKEWLNYTVTELALMQKTGLSIDYIATRDIYAGEEVFMNYGKEWEDAWQEHVLTWKPQEDAGMYQHSSFFNKNESLVLKTDAEQEMDPYPANLYLQCLVDVVELENWVGDIMQQYQDPSSNWDRENCRIIARDNVDDVLVYTTIVNWESKLKTVEKLPREAFVFTDKIKSTDQFLPNAFRHHIGVPDDMFPDTWMNL